MGYDTGALRIPLRLDNHGGPEQHADREAVIELKEDIEALIEHNPAYQRIAILGVEGG